MFVLRELLCWTGTSAAWLFIGLHTASSDERMCIACVQFKKSLLAPIAAIVLIDAESLGCNESLVCEFAITAAGKTRPIARLFTSGQWTVLR